MGSGDLEKYIFAFNKEVESGRIFGTPINRYQVPGCIGLGL